MERGRPSIYSKAIADEICRRLANGETLRRMCADHEHLPHRDTVTDWLVTKQGFSDRVADARAIGSSAIVEEARDIVDDGTNDWMEKHRDGQVVGWQINGEHVTRSRLRADQRWREAEAHQPKVYGKKQQVEHSGVVALSITNRTDDELIQDMLELVASGRLKLPGGVELIEDDAADDDYSDIC